MGRSASRHLRGPLRCGAVPVAVGRGLAPSRPADRHRGAAVGDGADAGRERGRVARRWTAMSTSEACSARPYELLAYARAAGDLAHSLRSALDAFDRVFEWAMARMNGAISFDNPLWDAAFDLDDLGTWVGT